MHRVWHKRALQLARLAIVKQIMAAMHFSEGLETEGELQDNHWRLLLDRHIRCSSEMLMERCFSREECEIVALPEGFLRFPMAEERKQKAVAISSAVST